MRRYRSDLVGLGLLVLLIVFFPLAAPVSLVDSGVYAMIYALAAIGLTLLMGLAGQVSLGQAAFFAIGGYTQAILVTRYHWPAPVSGVLAVVLAMVAAALLGLPLLRLRGHYLALATLGLGVILSVAANDWDFTGATSGIYGVPKPAFNGRVYDSPQEYFWLLGPVLVVAVLVGRNVTASRIGRALAAVNDSELAAEALGVDTFRLRWQVFTLSAGYAGLGGVCYAHWLGVVNAGASDVSVSVKLLLISVLGGLGTVWGALIGGFLVEFLDEGLRQAIPHLVPGAAGEVQLIGFGLILTLLIVLLPGGLHQLAGPLRRLFRRPGTPGPAPAGELVRPPRVDRSGPVLRVEGIGRRFGGVLAVDGVDLAVGAGEIVALIGPNGAGKTTCFDVISGVRPPSAGTVRVRGQRTSGRRPHVFARAGATRTFQSLAVFGSMTAHGNVLVGRHRHGRRGLLSAILVLPARREERRNAAVAAGLLALVGLTADADRPAADLPYGRQRLLELARALATEPELLLLDEPMAGLTGAERREVARLLARLRADGMAILLVEHDVRTVLELADRVAVLDDGRLIALDTPDRVRRDPAVVAAYLGTDGTDGSATGTG